MGTDTAADATAFVGIDVSKDTLDACLILPGGRAKPVHLRQRRRGPTPALLAAWELTGTPRATTCTSAWSPPAPTPRHPPHTSPTPGGSCGVANPPRVTYAGLARGRGNKTDRADAEHLSAEYAARERPKARQPPPPEARGNGRRWCDASTT